MKYQEFHSTFIQFCTDKNLEFDGPKKINKNDGTVTIIYDIHDFTQLFRTISLIVSKEDIIMGISLRGIKLKEVADNLNGMFFNIPVSIIYEDYSNLFQQIILRANDLS